MKKQNVYVVISSEEERLRAIEILNKFNEKIWINSLFLKEFLGVFKIALHKKEWKIIKIIDTETRIDLDQLHELLKN